MTSTFQRCEKCREYGWHDASRCRKKPFAIWLPEHGETEEDAETVYADDAEEAAEKRVERFYDDGDEPQRTKASARDGDVIITWEIEPEYRVEWHASEVERRIEAQEGRA